MPKGLHCAGTVRHTTVFSSLSSSLLCVAGVFLLVFLFGGVAQAASPKLSSAETEVVQEASIAYKAKDYARVKSLLQPLADKNVSIATFVLGLLAVRGEGENQDYRLAEKWWTQSAGAGFADAQFNLGYLYFSGVLGSRDFVKAREQWSKAVANRQMDACYGLGLMQIGGMGGPKDPARAVKNFRRAADAGHPRAMYALGQAYKFGEGVKKDAKAAKLWFSKAKAAGLTEAEAVLDEL